MSRRVTATIRGFEFSDRIMAVMAAEDGEFLMEMPQTHKYPVGTVLDLDIEGEPQTLSVDHIWRINDLDDSRYQVDPTQFEFRQEQTRQQLRCRHDMIMTFRRHLDALGYVECDVFPHSRSAMYQLAGGGIGRGFLLNSDGKNQFSPTALEIFSTNCTSAELAAEIEPAIRQCLGCPDEPLPAVQVSYRDCLVSYGTAAPNVRNPFVFFDLTRAVYRCGGYVEEIDSGQIVVAIPAWRHLGCRGSFDTILGRISHRHGIEGMLLQCRRFDDGLRLIPEADLPEMCCRMIALDTGSFEENDVVVVLSGPSSVVRSSLGEIREFLFDVLQPEPTPISAAWVVSPPRCEISRSHTGVRLKGDAFTKTNYEQEVLDVTRREMTLVIEGKVCATVAEKIHTIEEVERTSRLIGLTVDDVQSLYPIEINCIGYGCPPFATFNINIGHLVDINIV